MSKPITAIIMKIKSKDKECFYVVLDDRDRIISISDSLENAENDFHEFNRYKNLFNVRLYKLFDLGFMGEIKKYLNELSF